jgi:arylsulfatase A-like enzyme
LAHSFLGNDDKELPMNCRSLRRLDLLLVLPAAAASLAPALGATEPPRPNIIVIMTDDQRWDTLDAPPMANVLALAAGHGVRFFKALVTTPLCCPSRASFLTGKLAHDHGVQSNNGGASAFEPEEVFTLATQLAGAGYATGLFGKYLNDYAQREIPGSSPPAFEVPPGWTEWQAFAIEKHFEYQLTNSAGQALPKNAFACEQDDYATDVLTDRAIGFIQDRVAAGGPFFVFLSLKAPHSPHTPLLADDAALDGLAPWRPESFDEPDASDKPPWLQGTRCPRLSCLEKRQLHCDRANQLEMLRSVDAAVGRVRQAVDASPVAANTMIVFTSDNGFNWGEHRLIAKRCPYEECLRVPLVIRWPAAVPESAGDVWAQVTNLDLTATIAHEAGVEGWPPSPGESLGAYLRGIVPFFWRRHVLAEGWKGALAWVAVREENVDAYEWKYIESSAAFDGQAILFRELYNLSQDPDEGSNLIQLGSAPPVVVARLQSKLAELHQHWPPVSRPGEAPKCRSVTPDPAPVPSCEMPPACPCYDAQGRAADCDGHAPLSLCAGHGD